LGLSPVPPQNVAYTPTLKHTGQEPGCLFIKPFRILIVLQSKSVNDVCKLLQLSRAWPVDPTGGLSSHDPWATGPPMKISDADTDQYSLVSSVS